MNEGSGAETGGGNGGGKGGGKGGAWGGGSPDPLPAPARAPVRDSASRTEEITCERCGAAMYDRHCKVICPNCGYQRDCSDP